MAKPPEPWGSLADPPCEVRITVIPGARPHRPPVRFRAWIAAAVATALAATAAIVVTNRATAPRVKAPVTARTPGPVGIAAAYRYPLGCLSVTISQADPAYASARLDRASPCWRYGAYVTAIFSRVRGEWRLALEARSGTCPPLALPPAVQAQLAVCSATRSKSRERMEHRRRG